MGPPWCKPHTLKTRWKALVIRRHPSRLFRIKVFQSSCTRMPTRVLFSQVSHTSGVIQTHQMFAGFGAITLCIQGAGVTRVSMPTECGLWQSSQVTFRLIWAGSSDEAGTSQSRPEQQGVAHASLQIFSKWTDIISPAIGGERSGHCKGCWNLCGT